MKLTEKQAVDLSIELWEWLAKTGKQKEDWPEWKEIGFMAFWCPLCEYQKQVGKRAGVQICKVCPYYKRFGRCSDVPEETIFRNWNQSATMKGRRKYAALFLEQLKALK